MKKKNPEGSSIGEMMLAKTVLEEKNEALEGKDRQIRELAGRVRRLTEEAAALRAEAQAEGRRREEDLASARLESTTWRPSARASSRSAEASARAPASALS